jgi:SAM-dependent methyltransferase
MSDKPDSYRQQFAEPAKARLYDAVDIGEGSYSDLLWEIEKLQLTAVVDELRSTHERIDLLDFATGTGRIIGFLDDQVDFATGIDVSAAMVEVAREKLPEARMICKDITSADDEIEGRYDLITAFRFALNAEPALFLAAMKALAARLRDESSVLVFNNHGNPFSHKLPLWPYHAVRRIGRGYITEGNYLTNHRARKVAAAAGLTIDRVLGCGLLSAKSLRVLGYDRANGLERTLASYPVLRPFAVNQMYVARLSAPR